MFENYFWLFVTLAVIGLILILLGNKKRPGHLDSAPAIRWGVLFMAIGFFGGLARYISLPAVLLLFLVIAGLIIVADTWLLAQKRLRSEALARCLADYSCAAFPLLLVIFLVCSFLVEPFIVPSGSMLPRLAAGDLVLINKSVYGFRMPVFNSVISPVGKVQHGDVVVFNHPITPRINDIKRVIGLPGDTVEYRKKRLTINGLVALELKAETYEFIDQPQNSTGYNGNIRELYGNRLYNILKDPASPTLTLSQVMDFPGRDQCQYDDDGFVCKVPADKYFVMGDNRDGSSDSRYWGFVDDHLLVGQAFVVSTKFLSLGLPIRL